MNEPPHACLSDEAALSRAYQAMLLARRFEEKAGMLYALGRQAQPCLLGIGMEAAWAAIASVVQHGDRILASPAHHGLRLALGAGPAVLFRELAAGSPEAAPTPDAWAEVQPNTGAAVHAAAQDHAVEEARRHTGTITVAVRPASSIAAYMHSLTGQSGNEAPASQLHIIICPDDVDRGALDECQREHPVRMIDGTDVLAISEVLRQERLDARVAGGSPRPVIVIRTPAFQGHANRGARRNSPGTVPADPLKTTRQYLADRQCVAEADLAALEARIRDAIAEAAHVINGD